MSWTPSAKGPRRTFRIGKYKVLRHIATGGMGAVYKAYDTENHRDVALKVLTREMAAKPAMVERFEREARNAGLLLHENIVTIYEFDKVNESYFIAMEYVEGIDLHEYIVRKKTLDPEEARQIMIQASRALDNAHHHGIVHRDIKPSNFLLSRDRGQLVVKLTDLGLSRLTVADEHRVTRAGTTVGTVDYISPEQARDSGAADVRSDLYSLGCTWYHMLAGRAPFAEGGLADRLYNHLNKEPEDVRQFNPRVTEATGAVLLRLLAKDPVDRYQTPAELLKDLELLDEPGASSTIREELQGLAKGTGEEETTAGLKTRVLPGPSTSLRSNGPVTLTADAAEPSAAQAAAPARPRRRIWTYVLLALGGLLILVGVVLGILFRGGR